MTVLSVVPGRQADGEFLPGMGVPNKSEMRRTGDVADVIPLKYKKVFKVGDWVEDIHTGRGQTHRLGKVFSKMGGKYGVRFENNTETHWFDPDNLAYQSNPPTDNEEESNHLQDFPCSTVHSPRQGLSLFVAPVTCAAAACAAAQAQAAYKTAEVCVAEACEVVVVVAAQAAAQAAAHAAAQAAVAAAAEAAAAAAAASVASAAYLASVAYATATAQTAAAAAAAAAAAVAAAAAAAETLAEAVVEAVEAAAAAAAATLAAAVAAAAAAAATDPDLELDLDLQVQRKQKAVEQAMEHAGNVLLVPVRGDSVHFFQSACSYFRRLSVRVRGGKLDNIGSGAGTRRIVHKKKRKTKTNRSSSDTPNSNKASATVGHKILQGGSISAGSGVLLFTTPQPPPDYAVVEFHTYLNNNSSSAAGSSSSLCISPAEIQTRLKELQQVDGAWWSTGTGAVVNTVVKASKRMAITNV
jgi:hypothetical protein